MAGGFLGSIVQGFAFGTGSSIARHGVDAMMGGGGGAQQQQQEYPAAPSATPAARAMGPCDRDQQQFLQCLQSNNGNASACEIYFQTLQDCQIAQGRN